jgi:hypothetical protein
MIKQMNILLDVNIETPPAEKFFIQVVGDCIYSLALT